MLSLLQMQIPWEKQALSLDKRWKFFWVLKAGENDRMQRGLFVAADKGMVWEDSF